MARAMAIDPKLLLMDEVTGGVDQKTIPGLVELVKKLKKTGVTIITIEHNINIIMETEDAVLLTGPAAADPSLDFTGDSSSDLPGSASGDTADDLKLAYGSNIFVACDDRKLFSSTDGDTWTKVHP